MKIVARLCFSIRGYTLRNLRYIERHSFCRILLNSRQLISDHYLDYCSFLQFLINLRTWSRRYRARLRNMDCKTLEGCNVFPKILISSYEYSTILMITLRPLSLIPSYFLFNSPLLSTLTLFKASYLSKGCRVPLNNPCITLLLFVKDRQSGLSNVYKATLLIKYRKFKCNKI